jgi:hypothetical protein
MLHEQFMHDLNVDQRALLSLEHAISHLRRVRGLLHVTQRRYVTMLVGSAFLGISVFIATTPALAQGMTIVGGNPTLFQDYSSQALILPGTSPGTSARLIQYPVVDMISARLGVSEGSLELFRYRLEDAPSKATVLYGVVDGGGLRLKVCW